MLNAFVAANCTCVKAYTKFLTPSGLHRVLGFTPPLTEMSTKELSAAGA
jgi:hypothetical protein